MKKNYLEPEVEVNCFVLERNFLGSGDRNITSGTPLDPNDFEDDDY